MDVTGAYSNIKDQFRELESLVKKLPDLSAPMCERPSGGYRMARQLKLNQIERLTAGYRAGETVYELGAWFRINRKTVSATLKRHRV